MPLKNKIMRHLLLLSALLLVSATSVAQLYVAPNTTGAGTDSYLYVNDQVLFVEDDITLVENTVNPATEASIYLRNGSQLIQGESDGANSGSGYISVYRENPGSDAWDYTFYGSPVGDIFTTPAAGAGNINFGSKSLFYKIDNFTESNPANLTANHNGYTTGTGELFISHRWIYTRSVGTAASWVRMYGNNVAPAGQGFIMKGVNQGGIPGNLDYEYDFRGRPNNGTITITTIDPVLPLTTEQVLTGNPYPSALDLNRLFYDTRAGDPDGTDNLGNSEISEIRYWDEDRTIDSHLYVDNKGGFGTWVPGTSNPDGTNPGTYTAAPFLNYDAAGNPSGGQTGTGALYERRFAPVGQGFYLKTIASNASDGSLNQVLIKNQYRRFVKEGAANNSEFRTAANPTDAEVATPDNRLPQVRIYTYFDETHFRDMVLAFSDNSTDYYDRGMDARHPMDASFADAYFPVDLNGNQEDFDKFVIQTVPFAAEKRIPYAIKLDQQTNVTVQIVDMVKMNNIVYLYDKELDTYTKISGDSTASLNLPSGDYYRRFFIVFKSAQTGTPYIGPSSGAARASEVDRILSTVDFFQNNRASQLEIMNPEGYDIKYAHIFDMTGKLIVTRTDIGTSRNYNISTATMADGVYLVKLVTDTNVSIDYKAIVTNK
jgi:hypothetical protein